MRFTTILPQLLLLVLMGQVALTATAGNNKQAGPTEADRRKAEYLFVEAISQKSHDRMDAYYDLLNYAHNLDTTNTTISFYLGYCLLTMDNTTPPLCERGLALMKQHFEAHPDDLYETTFYSDANLQLNHPQEALRAIKVLNETNPNRLELQVRLAEAYARTGDYVQSNATYDSIVALHDEMLVSVTGRKISNYMALNDSVSAINQMRTVLATAPRNAMYNLTMSSLWQEFSNRDSSLYYLNRAQEYEPDNGYVYLAKAQFYAVNGDSVEYDNQIYRALTAPNLDVDDKLGVMLSYIRNLLSEQDTTQRVNNLFTVLIEQHPHEAKIRDLYSEYLVAKEDYKGAAEQLGYSLDLNPTDAKGWRNLMLINMMDENFPAAIRAAERALEYNPESLDLYSYIAPSYYQMKEYDKALQTYDKALTLVDSADVETRSDLIGGKGDVYFDMGDTLRAFQTYEEALALYPGNVGIMNNYAYFLALSGVELDKAERMSAMAVKQDPDNATYIDTYAWVFFVKGDYPMALMYIKSAVDKDTDGSSDLLDRYGDILFFNGDKDQAVEKWKLALDLDPSNELLQRKVRDKTYYAK